MTLAAFAFAPRDAAAKMTVLKQPLDSVFTPISFISPASFAASILDHAKEKRAIETFCADLAVKYRRYGWREDPCGKTEWHSGMTSRGGRPLIYAVFGKGSAETTLLLGGVHPDELTPISIAFRMAHYLQENPGVVGESERVIVAPIVNPDGFLREKPTRTNLSGVDLNRNFFTFDWYQKAKKLWQDHRDGGVMHFPGYVPNSEIETIFQIQLLDDFKPDKILSLHAPLGFLDYDGPGDGLVMSRLTPAEEKAKKLVKTISEKSQNYKVVDFNYYPGSLGNYAGKERHIPTVTLELETTDPKMADTYWRQFLPGILQTIHYPFVMTPDLAASIGNASPFSALYLTGKKPPL